MKKALLVFVLVFGVVVCSFSEDSDRIKLDKDASYSLGMYMGIMNSQQLPPMDLDYTSFLEGFRDYNESLETRFTADEAMAKISAAFIEYATRMGLYDPAAAEAAAAEDSANVEANRTFLAENGLREGVTTTASGLQYEVLVEGSGPKPSATDMVRVHYEGMFIDGTVFDSSYVSGTPAEFSLNAVITGWSEGVQLMNEGSTYNLYIPPDLGYGEYRAGNIPGNSTLIFKIELLEIL